MADSSNSSKDTELTMCDVLQEEQELEEDANAVLGGSDDTNCSYDEGYVPRQALYACKTCKISGEAGVCLACCYACHDGHEVVELYTKRNFRCDCGNSKFVDKTCTLRSDKEPLNSKNKYNHNFKGLYCSCSRPYPDLEDDVPDEMIQCVLCEDWYHGRHLGVSVPEEYAEMICEKCMQSHKFLYSYLNKYNVMVDVDDSFKNGKSSQDASNGVKPGSASAVPESTNDGVKSETVGHVKSEAVSNSKSEAVSDVKSDAVSDVKSEAVSNVKSETVSDVKPETVGDGKSETVSGGVKSELSNDCNGVSSTSPIPETGSDSIVNVKDENVTEDTKGPETAVSVKEESKESLQTGDASVTENADDCLLKNLTADGISTGSALWPENWRKELCRCSTCMAMYVDSECEFLLDPDDTIQAYEERGKGRGGQSQYDKGLSALGQLDRVKQMEAVRAYTSMKGQLKEYLKEFADNKRTVSANDINEFFERMRKKQKLNNGVPHFCR